MWAFLTVVLVCGATARPLDVLFSHQLSSAADFDAFSVDGGGFGQAGRTMKFLVDARNISSVDARGDLSLGSGATVYWINGNFAIGGQVPEFAKYHYAFAQKALGLTEGLDEFNEGTYFRARKSFFAGTLQTYHLEGQRVYAVQLYPDDVCREGGILQLVTVIKSALNISGSVRYTFVASGPQQTFATVLPQLAALGFEAMTIEQVLGNVTYLPLNAGEAFGYLRVFPTDGNSLLPTDIVLFDELPLDLTVVAATITTVVQDVTSHVNLKAKERGTPNCMMRDPSSLLPFKDMPVHIIVGKSNFTIELTTAAIVEQKLKERLNKPWVTLPEVNEPNLYSFDQMCVQLSPNCTSNGNRFGGKAAMLGFLANKRILGRVNQTGSFSYQYGYDLVPWGFAVPVGWYRDFLAANSQLNSAVQMLAQKEMAGALSPNLRHALAAQVQALFYSSNVPTAHMDAAKKMVAQLGVTVPNLSKLKVRSSANAEDIDGFDGAGLHDSFGAKVNAQDNPDNSCKVVSSGDGPVTKLQVKPKTVQCAIKASYASLWNARAIEERTFARINQTTTAMGLAIVPAYDTEDEVVANGVIITKSVSGEFIAYTLSVNEGNNLVTNPDPGTTSEMTLATFSSPDRPPRFTVVRYATNRTTSVLSEDDMTSIIRLAVQIEVSYCRTKPGYYTSNPCSFVFLDSEKQRSLDIEFKLLANGQFVVKQAREFHG